ncbi:3-dehydroquinate synthase [Brachyspira hyodysenteriae]|uniref:3-dehydroquinate synthase n=1 Tax=Brachyspira hyodysenteriae TaxID=159 RepID=UPI0022CD3C22|nr:3-dehydroquinate synthase [Brachyspira hyodysenteriae]MCZ9840212.1 3-dehydroquinate synthase [Brachyspira hyodysenteriae]MCZ9848600.1 3-dehydroquinate synthase [Brachyspira hyodysenteriae]MCZ9871961.1 3-dehydroquinate synthase [Brachyspira hyodysenteriae]MCZ9929935.1 3-dehydroquinate synthase [Brachyspira hyodysenteriae]
MNKVEVKIQNDSIISYDILVQKGLIKDTGKLVKNILRGKRALIVTDDIVDKLYTNIVKGSLEKEDIITSVCVLPNGEPNKNIESINNIFSSLAKNELSRKDIVIALGGGVIGDMAGYAAAVWMRGIDFVQIPTTLLACVDSSVGGKTGINIKEGKNLVGAFHSPKLVIIDSDTLLSLPKREFNEGMAEVIKHAFLFDEALLELIEAHIHNNKNLDMDFILKRNCELKAHIVQIDYKEKKERMFLNFGHTIGHSVENAAGYGVLLHGEAVAIGMIFAIEYGIRKGITKDKNILERAKNVLSKFSLPISIPDNINLKDSIKLDKKRSDDKINFVFLESIGKPYVEKVSIDDILNE